MEFSQFKPPFIEDFHLPCLIIREVCHSLNACQKLQMLVSKTMHIIIKGANGIQRGVYFTAATVTENPMNLVFYAPRLLQHPVTLHLGLPYLVLSKNMKHRNTEKKNSSNMWTTIINYKLVFFHVFSAQDIQTKPSNLHAWWKRLWNHCSVLRGKRIRRRRAWKLLLGGQNSTGRQAIGKSAWFEFTGSNLGMFDMHWYVLKLRSCIWDQAGMT